MAKLPKKNVAYYLVNKRTNLAQSCAAHYGQFEGLKARADELIEKYGAVSARIGRVMKFDRYHIAGLMFTKDKIPYRWEFDKQSLSFRPEVRRDHQPDYTEFYGDYRSSAYIRYYSQENGVQTMFDLSPYLPKAQQDEECMARVGKLNGQYIVAVVLDNDRKNEQSLIKHLKFPFVRGARMLPDAELERMKQENPQEALDFNLDAVDWLTAPMRDPVFNVSKGLVEVARKKSTQNQFRLTWYGNALTKLRDLAIPSA